MQDLLEGAAIRSDREQGRRNFVPAVPLISIFKVVEVIDSQTIRVAEMWRWQGKRGDRIRPTGYRPPEEGQPGFEEAVEKLGKFILGEEVELSRPQRVDSGRLVCHVVVDGTPLMV